MTGVTDRVANKAVRRTRPGRPCICLWWSKIRGQAVRGRITRPQPSPPGRLPRASRTFYASQHLTLAPARAGSASRPSRNLWGASQPAAAHPTATYNARRRRARFAFSPQSGGPGAAADRKEASQLPGAVCANPVRLWRRPGAIWGAFHVADGRPPKGVRDIRHAPAYSP